MENPLQAVHDLFSQLVRILFFVSPVKHGGHKDHFQASALSHFWFPKGCFNSILSLQKGKAPLNTGS